MSISNPYYESWYNGDGSTVTFSFAYNGSEESGFDPISANYVKCHIIFSDGTAITPTFTVDTILSTITISALTTPEDEILNAPPVGAKIRIYRDVPETQELTPTALKTATTTQIIQAFDRIVAMIQEEQFFTSNGTINLDERQRGMLLDYLTETNDSTILYYDYAEDKIKPTTFVKEDIVRSVGGMFLRQIYDTLGNPIFQYSLNGTNWESILCGEAANNHDNLSGRDLPSQHPAASIDFDNTGTDIQATTVEGALEELDDDLSTHIANTNNPHSVTKAQVGLGNVDNTSDADKPISTATQTALNSKQPKGDYATKTELATVATSGSYNDLSDKPTIPTVNNPTITFTQGGVTKGSFTLNQATDDTIDLDAGGGSGSGYHPDLFDHKWADHQLNDVSWLRADTFSWQSGDVYSAAYQHLVDDIDGKTLQSETIGGTTIQFYLADDGHKICPASEESNVSAIYNSTGIAWYYLLDTVNQRFKLPRTKWGFTGLRDSVGGYVAPGLPNITGSFSTASDKNLESGAFSWTADKYSTNGGGQGGQWGINFSAKKSNSIYGNSDTVQPPATQMYLYFYVGNFEQSAIEQTAGLNAEMFNDLNAHKVIEFQAPTSANNYTWYRKYADGWVEQGGIYNSSNLTYVVPMADTNYVIFLQAKGTSGKYAMNCQNITTTGASIQTEATQWHNYSWQVSGMSA